MEHTRRFLASYRRPGRVIVRVLEGPDRGKHVEVDLDAHQRVRGGRDVLNDIVLNDEAVSSTHFELLLSSRGVLLRDLESMNGVRVGSLRVREAWIEPNAVFEVGNSTLQLVAADEVEVALSPTDHFEELHGQSHVMRALFLTLDRLATKGDRLRVLIGGETGTGKELVARGLHKRSPRARGPFIVRDCSTIPGELAESALFGHRKGAFTGATTDHPGCFEEANGGTLFLDEIGELPLELQAKLLRVLQEGIIVRVGENTPRKVDVRVISATHRDLHKLVTQERFRKDLYFRIADVKVHLPSLYERREEEVVMLAELFLARCCTQAGVVRSFHPDVHAALLEYTWPGNVRELKSVVERAFIMADTDIITRSDLALTPEDDERRAPVNDELFLLKHAEAIAAFERSYFAHLLAQHPTKVKAARAADMTSEGLRLALKRLHLSP